MQQSERLRFAPSPTGDLHIGGARSALFNWLYARKTGGKFLLRIEDTDAGRSTKEALESILASLRWLGLAWDEDLVFQSQRGDLYRKAVDDFLANGSAYRCFCTKEELETERERAVREKLDYHYSGKCRNLDEKTVARNLDEGREYTVRFRVPEGETSFDDLVHGAMAFQNGTIGDFIIARADGSPVYLLGVAVDDADMGITLVMRGDDHLSNTPKQIMLMRALGKAIPRFAHIPQVLGADKKKLSKRHGAASVIEYQRMGFLPVAVVNFIALLGWNPGDDREKMVIDELIDAFSIEGLAKKSGVFDIQKLEWLNGQYLHEMSHEELLGFVGPQFVERGFIAEHDIADRHDYLLTVVRLLRERCRLMNDFAEQGVFFFRDPATYEEKGVKKHFSAPGVAELLDALADSLESLDVFTAETTEEAMRELSGRLNLQGAGLIHAARLAVTGLTYGPGLFEILTLLGRDTVGARLRRASSYIHQKV
ncbi:glutamate--tRNA ligase [bacterium]|nr:glutamate--tRNA ligase [bacterium]